MLRGFSSVLSDRGTKIVSYIKGETVYIKVSFVSGVLDRKIIFIDGTFKEVKYLRTDGQNQPSSHGQINDAVL